jgi:1,4-dihydroxy-2-naphthoate octaprenyltransferase
MGRLRNLLRFSRFLYLLLASLTYALGAGIARYLGQGHRSTAFWLGLVWVVLLLLSMSHLTEVFRPSNEPLVAGEKPSERLALRNASLLVATAVLTCAAIAVFLMAHQGLLSPLEWFFLGLTLLVSLAYAVPPLRLAYTGFGELFLAVLLADLIPAFSFLLQAGEFHRLLALIVFSLTSLALAFFLVLDFPSYGEDLKYGRRTLLTRLGWERAVPLHHTLVLLAYLLFMASPVFGVPWTVIWPVFLTFPFGILQILWLRNIALGGRPMWNFLITIAVSVLGLTSYFLTLTFWIR